MTTVLERQVLAQPLQTFVTAQSPVIPVEWPNTVFPKPIESVWLRFTVIDASAKQLQMGSPGYNEGRVLGSLIIGIFWPIGDGDGQALALADQIGSLYRQQVFNFSDLSGLVRTRYPNVRVIGRTGDSVAFYQVNVTVPFIRDDLP